MNRKHIVVIGAGFSGLLTTLQLLRQGEGHDFEVTLIERSGDFGPGLAFGVTGDTFRLNVPVQSMGAWHDRPGDFLEWLTAHKYLAAGRDFVPREWFGRYLRDLLENSLASDNGRKLKLVTGLAHDVIPTESGFKVVLQNGSSIECSNVVIAIGNLQRSSFQGMAVSDIFSLPYDLKSYANIAKMRSLLIVGTGLSAVDCILECEHRGFSGAYVMVSRHGRLPLRFKFTEPPSPEHIVSFPRGDLRKLVRTFAAAIERGITVESVIAQVRPHIQELWRSLSPVDQRRFLRHVRPIWECNRHRIPDAASDVVEGLMTDKRICVTAGRLGSVVHKGSRIQASVFVKGNEQILDVDRAFLCAGSEGDLPHSDLQVVKNSLSRELLFSGPLGLGARDTLGAYESQTPPRIIVVGPLQREELWEVTSVPELRVSAFKAAQALLSDMIR